MNNSNLALVPDLSPLLDTTEFTIKNTAITLTLQEAKKALADYSPSKFEDSVWLITVAQKEKNNVAYDNTLYFTKFPSDERVVMTKKWTIQMLLMRQSLSQIRQKIYKIRAFIAHTTDYKHKYFTDYTQQDFIEYYSFVFDNEHKKQTKLETWLSIKQFMNDIGCGEQVCMMEKFTIPLHKKEKRNDAKYIPNEIADKLDYLFKTDPEIPLAYKCIYWTLRFFINRINEVCSMKDNCLKQITEDTYILSLPTFKQSGPYATPQIRLIEIKYEGVGAFYIDLLKEQIEYAKNHRDPNADINFLFRSPMYMYQKRTKTYSLWGNDINTIKRPCVSNFMKKYCEGNNIVDENGTPYNVTTHQFRHNAISDRLNSGTFRSIDITSLTGHHNTKMIEQTYTHTTTKQLSEIVHNIEHGDVNTPAPIIFHGRIINGKNEDKRFEQIISRPFAKQIHNLGICSDIRNCSKDHFQCLKCEYLIPDVENLDYYIYEKENWEKKLKKAQDLGMDYFAENCEYNIEIYEHFINRIRKVLTNEEA